MDAPSRLSVLVLAAMSLGLAGTASADRAPDAAVAEPTAAEPATPSAPPPPPPAAPPAPVQPPAEVRPAASRTQARAPQAAPAAARLARVVAQPWVQTSIGDGIITYKRDVPGSDIIALRGVATVAAPIAKVASVLLDYSRSQEWIDDLELVRIVRWLGPSEFIEYDRIATPPIIMKDRDFVCRGTLVVHEQSLVMTVDPATDPAAPPYDRYVRGELRGYWKLKAIDGGKHSLIVAEMHGDPKGGVPKWVVNLFQQGWARNTVESLRKQVAKPDIKVMPQLQAAFEGKPFAFGIKSR